jgi:NAD-dependent DNA ligase
MTILKDLKFKVVYHEKKSTSDLNMAALSKILIDRRNVSPYEVDGIVVFHNAEHNQVSGKNPSYAFAFKSILTHEEAEVIVKEVTWNISKDGYLKPLIHFDPVVLSGATIQKATGFNAQYIEEHAIGPGSRIVIIRSGDVIPHVVRILTKSASATPSFPDIKAFPWKWNETHVDIMLVDKSSAKEVVIKQIEHFASSLGIKGVGKGVVERFYENGITSIKKLITIEVDAIVKMEGFQKKSAEKIVKEIHVTIQKSNCLDFMVASNIFGRAIAEKKLKLILDRFPSILDNKSPTEEELSSIEGIGPITAKQFIDGLPLFFEFMKDINIPCKQTTVKQVESSKPSLAHLQVVFTGVRDKELEEEIEARGGKVSTSVSKKVSVVIAKNPDDETGKVKAAKELDIKVVSLEQFKKDYM